jgi:hypothetical protein
MKGLIATIIPFISNAPEVRRPPKALNRVRFDLHRDLVEKGFDCMLCAPSLIPKKAANG